MADWGLYTALRGTDDWQTKRQDKMMNLMIAEKQEARAQQDLQQSAALEQGIQDYFNELQSLDVLPEDQERVKQAEKDARQKVIAGIASNGGDLKRYMSSGGITDVNEYKRNVMGSEAVKQAGVNKVNLQNYLTDRSKGNQRARFVDVDVPVMGADGQPSVDEEGNPMTQTQKMKFEDQMALFKAGKIDKINYNGSETRINVGIEDFSKLYKNPADPYQKDNYVTESDIYKKAMSKGASEEYARDIAARYGQMYDEGGDAWRWNSKDPYELQLKQQALALKAQKQNAAIKAASERKLGVSADLNAIVPALKALGDGGSMEMAVKERDFWQKQFGMYKADSDSGEKGFKLPKGTTGIDAYNVNIDDYDLGLAHDIHFNKYVAKKDKNGNLRRFIEVTATYGDVEGFFNMFAGGGRIEGTPLDQSFGGYTGLQYEDAEENWVTSDWDDGYTGTVLLPIDSEISTPTVIAALNDFSGLDKNADYTPGSKSNEDIVRDSAADLQYLVETTGLSVEEIFEAGWLEKLNYDYQTND